MAYTEDQLWDLLRESVDMPYGTAQIALTEQIVTHADALQARELSFKARLHATNAYVYGGEPAKSFVTFAWCLAEYDRDPVYFRSTTHTLLWQFKATIGGLVRFPEIPLEHTLAVLDDMDRRWREGGHSPHAVYRLRHRIAEHLGDRTTAEEWFGKWCAAPRDDLSDCVGCDPTGKAAWLADTGRDEEAIALAEPVLGGRLTCSEQPQGILAALMVPYLRTGRLDAARDAHRRAYRAHRANLADLGDIADHIEFCALTGNESAGLEMVRRHIAWLDSAPSPHAAMRFATNSALLLRRVAEAGFADATVARPASGGRPAAEVGVGALADDLVALALEIAGRFDARNGSGLKTEWVRGQLAAEPIVDHLPLSPTSRIEKPVTATPIGPEATVAIGTASVNGGTDEAAAPIDIPTDLDPDALLDVAENYYREERVDAAAAACDAFDERFGATELGPRQRGRRAELHGLATANAGDYATAELAWMSALDLFAEAGDELARQVTRSRLGQLMCRTDRADVGVPIAQDATDYIVVHGPVGRRASAYRRLAFVYMLGGRVEDALACLENAQEYAAVADDSRTPMWILVDRAGILGETGQVDLAYEAAERAREACRVGGFSTGLAAACWISGRACEITGRLGDALAAYDEALAATTDAEMRKQIRRQRAGMLAGTRRAAEAVDDLVDLVTDAASDGDEATLAMARYRLAMAYLNTGRPLDCAEVAEEALAVFEPYDPQAESVRHMLAQAYRALDQPDEAIAQLELVAESGAHRDCPELVGEMSEQIGDILDTLDRDAAAALRYAAAADAYREAGQQLELVRASRRRATSLMWADRVADAVEALAEADLGALALTSDDAAHGWERAMLACDGARILAAHGDLDGGILRIAPAISGLRAVGDTGAAAFAASIQADLLLRAERPAEAEPVITEALPDARGDSRQRLALQLVRTLDLLDRAAEAEAVRRTYGLGDPAQ